MSEPGKKSVPAIVADPLERETKVAARLEENGISVSAKSRAVAALDRLIGNILDFPSAALEVPLSRMRGRVALEKELRAISIEKAADAARTDPSFGDPYLARFRRQQIEEDENRLLVASAAIEDLRETPPQDDNGEAVKIDDDWVNEFAFYAARKRHPNIQQLWGKLLAGKIRNQGDFKLGMLARLATIDSDDAHRIHSFLLHAIDNKCVFRWSDPKSAPPLLQLPEILAMEELGILTSDSTLGIKFDLKSGAKSLLMMSGDALLIEATNDVVVNFPAYVLTSFGKLLAELIKVEPTPEKYLEEAVRELLKNPGVKIFTQPAELDVLGRCILTDEKWVQMLG